MDLYFPQRLIDRIKVEKFSGSNKVLGYKDKIVLIDSVCSPYKTYDSRICDMYYLRAQHFDSLYDYINENSIVERLDTNKDSVILQYDTKNSVFICVKNDSICRLIDVSIEEVIFNKNNYRCKLRFDEGTQTFVIQSLCDVVQIDKNLSLKLLDRYKNNENVKVTINNRIYYPIDEKSARIAHEMMSMRDYHEGSKTEEYRRYVDNAYDIVERIEKERPKYVES